MLRKPSLVGGAVALAVLLAGPLTADDGLRLGSNVRPTAQAISLKIDPAQADYSGSTTIELQIDAATSTFRFHSEDTTITSASLTGAEGALDIEHEGGEHSITTVTSAVPLKPGNYSLQLDFESPFNTQAIGLYRMESNGVGYAFTQFEPDDARLAFPGWDEPEFKIPFQVTVAVPEGQIAVSNTPEAGRSTANGWTTFTFQTTKPLPTYLVAIAAGPLETVDMPGLGVPGKIVTVAGQSQFTSLAREMTPPILQALEGYFGRKYPYEKLDFIAIPEYWPGAMEHPGAVTFADRVLILDPDSATLSSRRRLANIIAHELAHQWFGDLVTMQWWDDLWLNESFADWMGDRITHQVFPEFRTDLSTLEAAQGVMSSDASPHQEAIRQPVESTTNLLQSVGLAYDKGKTVISMFEHWMGPEVFRTGVNDYLKANEWGNATAEDLWQALDKASGRKVSQHIDTFISQPGVPLVTVRLLEDGKVSLSQTRFHNHGVEIDPQSWDIPVVLKYPHGDRITTHSVLLTGKEQTVDLGTGVEPAWIFPNAGGLGYYRWSVPNEILTDLAAHAPERLTEGERIGFLGNVGALLSGGLVDGGTYLAALSGFAADPQPMVLSEALDRLDAAESAFVTDDLGDEFEVYVRRLLGPALDRYGVAAKPGEEETVALLRPRLLGWLGETGKDPEVIAWARKTSKAFLEDPRSVDPSLVRVALSLTAHEGDAELFEELRGRFETAQVPALRSAYLSALGEFRDPAIIERALAYNLEGPLRPNELFTISRGVGDSEGGEELIWNWTTDNIQVISERMPPDFRAYLPFIGAGCDEARLKKTEEFFNKPENQAPGMDRTLDRVADGVEQCVALRQREGAAVAKFVEEFAAEP
ncbi:MAG: M1 family metallopeptidase [Thermoanaerobaculia bacterium]|nr:M1 family metallopeptidase [Thermoanaerobaculia bacterium]